MFRVMLAFAIITCLFCTPAFAAVEGNPDVRSRFSFGLGVSSWSGDYSVNVGGGTSLAAQDNSGNSKGLSVQFKIPTTASLTWWASGSYTKTDREVNETVDLFGGEGSSNSMSGSVVFTFYFGS